MAAGMALSGEGGDKRMSPARNTAIAVRMKADAGRGMQNFAAEFGPNNSEHPMNRKERSC
jgi:hypothetical protein